VEWKTQALTVVNWSEDVKQLERRQFGARTDVWRVSDQTDRVKSSKSLSVNE